MSLNSHRIDAHHHFWDPAAAHYPWMVGEVLDPIRRAYSPDDYAPELASQGIDGTVLVQTLSNTDETLKFLSTAAATAFIWGVVGWVDLTSPDVARELERLLNAPGGDLLVGIRHQVHDEEDAAWLGRDNVRAGIEAVLDAGLAYDLLVRARELPAAIDLVRAYPSGRFVLDHIAKPTIAVGSDDDWSARITELAQCPNVFVKLSGMVTEADWDNWTPTDLAPFISTVVDCFSLERVMFGSDWPVCLLASSYSGVVGALAESLGPLTEDQRAAVWGENAIRAYALKRRPARG